MNRTKAIAIFGRTIGVLIASSCLFASSQDLSQHHDHQSTRDTTNGAIGRGHPVVEEYRNYKPVERIDWSEANQTVDEIGGWRTYARDVYRYQRSKRKELPNQ